MALRARSSMMTNDRLRRRAFLRVTATALATAMMGLHPRLGQASPLTDGARAWVLSFAQEGVALLENRTAQPQARAEHFRRLLDRYFSLDAIGRWVLGRSWRDASPGEREEYLRLFTDWVIYGYVNQFSQYSGESLRVTRVVENGDGSATVFSQVDRPAGEQPINVDWRVGQKDADYRILDVIVENVSLSQTWRSDFAAVIQQGGGIGSLLQVLRERTAKLKAQLGIAP
jgi:phospholipid transport system substrate-binding protein